MKSLIFIFIALIIMTSPIYCQIDTLMLIEIGRLNTDGRITHLYIEDIDNDNIQELIICTNDHVYIYDSQTYEIIWTSPLLLNPQDIIFKDINNDGYIDFSVKDDLNIFLFDIMNDYIIGSSPTLDDTYRSYTIGDRNGDSMPDIVIVNQILTDYTVSQDTLWFEIYNSPAYCLEDTFFILIERWSVDEPFNHASKTESLNRIILANITEANQLHPFIFLFTNIGYWGSGPSGYESGYSKGRFLLIDAFDLDIQYEAEIGQIYYSDIHEANDSTYLYSIDTERDWSEGDWHSTIIKHVFKYSASTLYGNTFWNQTYYNEGAPDWRGWIAGDLNFNHEGDEISYSFENRIYLVKIPSMSIIWHTWDIVGLSSVVHSYRSQNLFNNSQIMCKITEPVTCYHFYESVDGSLSAILNNGFNFSKVIDIDNDDNDELLKIQNNCLFIYRLGDFVNVDNVKALPYSTFLISNYPNPFNSSTIIEYSLKQDEHIIIEIYDLLGRKVTTVANDNQPAGYHQVVWNAKNNTSGMYFYKIQAGDYSETKKMLLLK